MIDDFSRHTWIYPMRKKSEVFGHFQQFKAEAEKSTGQHVRFLRSYGDKEYFSDEFMVSWRFRATSGNEGKCIGTPACATARYEGIK